MSTFEQQYEELFGKKITYDPIKADSPEASAPPTPRLDLSQRGAAASPEAGTFDFDSFQRELLAGDQATPPPQESSTMKDFGRALVSGVGQTGEMGLGGLEYGARQAEQAMPTGVGQEIMSDVRRGLTGGRQALQQFDTDMLKGMSPDSLDRMQRQILTLDPDKSIWRGGPGETLKSIGLQFTQALPATVLTLLPAAAWFRAGMTPGALLYLGASEGALSMGGVANNIAQEVEQMPEDQLRQQSQAYKQMLGQGMDPETARQKLIAAAQNNAPLIAGLTVGAISATAGRWLEPVFSTEGMPLAKRFLTGFGEEAVQEAPQSAVEQYAQNAAAHAYDPNRNPWDQVLEQGAQGFLIGGLSGGAFAGVVGHGHAEQAANEAATGTPPTEGGDFAASFESVFGKNPDESFLKPPPGRITVVEDAPMGTTPDIRAVLEEGGQQKMYLPQPGELQAQGAQQGLPLGQPTFEARTNNVPAPAPGQQPLLLTRRVPGGSVTNEPGGPLPPATNYAPDMTSPTGRFENPNQMEIPGTQGQFAPATDVPSAEPVADLQAQIAEMERPESDRQAVYLSPDNIAQLRQNGNLNALLEHGVVLSNFDGKGGALIARDRQAAQDLMQLRDQSAGNMEEVLGLATGAGTGKPTQAEGVVVQRRDDAGNVVQESAQPNEQAAEALAQQWEKRYPNFDVQILTTQAAQGRRQLRLQQEQQKSDRRRKLDARQVQKAAVSQQVRQATAILPSEAPVEQLGMRETARRAAAGATSPTKAAARLIGQAARESAPAEQRRVGGFYPPAALEFKDQREAVRYAGRFSKLVDTELEQELKGGKPGTDWVKRRADLLQELGDIRERAKPIRKAARYVEAAARVAPEAVKKVGTEARVAATKTAEDVGGQGVEMLGQHGAVEPKGVLNVEELGKLTPAQIDNMSADKLDNAFKSAATWFAGRIQEGHTTTVPFDASVENLQTFANKYVPPSDRKKMQGARLYDRLVSRHQSPSMQRRFVKRVAALARGRQYGGKTQSKPITKTSAAMKGRAEIQRRKSKFNTQVLAGDVLPQDESPSARIQRESKAKKARAALDSTMRRGSALLDKLESGKFAEIAKEQTEEGLLTERARDMIHGRAYFRYLLQFASALHRSGNKGQPIINEMTKVDEFLRNAIRMPATDFARVMGRLLRAESHQQATELRNFGDFKAKLSDPEQREEANAEILQELMADEARRTRLEDVWRKNSFYNTIVEPIMRKFTDASFRDGYPSYKPNEEEMRRLQWVMDNWRTDSRFRENFYDPIRRFFSYLGFEWTKTNRDNTGGQLIIPRNKEGGYEYHPSDKALQPLFAKKFGTGEDVDLGVSFESRQTNARALTTETEIRRRQERRTESAANADTAATVEQFGRLAQANRIINKFRSLIEKSKTTIPGMIRSEQRLIRAFKELGMWTEVSPQMGTIKFRTPRSYRLVGPRLEAKQLRKEQAREILLKQLKAQPLPRDIAENPNVQRRGEQPLNAESEMFLENVTNPGPSIEQFRQTGLEIQRMLSDRSNLTTLGDVLNVMTLGLPESHVYHSLAQQLLNTPGVLDTHVTWDWRGQLAEKAQGATKWEYANDAKQSTLRYILLSNSKINARSEPQSSLLHSILHEAVHVATQGALDRSPAVRSAMRELQQIATRFMRTSAALEDADMPYGLRSHEGEFVAEAFSNIRFQQMLKRIRFDRGHSIWQKFVGLVKQLLGIREGQNEPRNAFEAVMSLQHHLFTGEQRTNSKFRTENLEDVDPVLRPTVTDVVGRIESIGDSFKQMWSRGRGPNAPLIAMSMRQMHKEFRRHFGVGKNSFDRYLEGWEGRNAENSRLMEEGERVSRGWTSATEKTSPAAALEFSRIITEATLYGVHADVSTSAPQNKHLTSAEQKQRASDLARRFAKLDPTWHQLYKRIRSYYQETLNREVDLLMLNALRGVLAHGDRAIMNRTEFDKKYNEDTVRKLGLTTKEGLEREFGTLDKNMLRTLQEIASIPTTREGPYFPLMRYGEFVVYAQRVAEQKTFSDTKQAFAYRAEKLASDPTLDVNVSGNTVYVTERDFRTAESRTEAEQMRDEMVKEYGREAVTDVQLKDTFTQEQSIQSGSALASILSTLNGNANAQNAVKNFWLRSLADRSFRKHQIRRKQRQGVDYDLQHRGFTNYVKQASYYISQLKFGWRMADAFREMQKFVRESRDTPEISSVRLGQVRDELRKRDEMTNDAAEMPKLVRRGAEIGQLYMLFGPSYWLINMTQPYMVTMPWLGARYGWGGAGAALTNAQKLIAHPVLSATKDSLGGLKALWSKSAAEKAFNVLDQVKETIRKRGGTRAEAYIQMLDQLRQQSVIDLSWIAELRDISEGRDTTKFQKVMDATRVMSHLTEVNNRIVSAIAAYDLRYNEVMARQGATHDLAHNAAIQTAKDAVAETQFDYSGGNKPRLFTQGGPAGRLAPLVFQFMQWPQHMYAMLISNMAAAVNQGTVDRKTAIKTLLGLFATHAAAGGILGITLQPIKWAIGFMLMALSGDNEPYDLKGALSGENFDRSTRQLMAEIFGNGLGAVVSQGLPEMAGVRLTDRVSLGTVYYLDLKTDTAESTFGSLLSGFGGPLVSMGFSGWRAAQYMLEGDLYRGLETLMPKGVRDIMKAYRYSAEGVVNNAGDTIIQTDGVSPYQVFLQAMGFTPSEISEFYSKQALIKDTQQLGTNRRDGLLKRFRNATTIEARNRVLEEVATFNKTFPAAAITRSALIRAVTAKAERQAEFNVYGAALKGRATMYAHEGEFYDTE